MTAVDPRINDHMTGVQLRLIREKLDEERRRTVPRSQSVASDYGEQETRLQAVMQKRQALLDRLRETEFGFERPNTFTGRRHSPRPSPPPSRRSLPEQQLYSQRNRGGQHPPPPPPPQPQYTNMHAAGQPAINQHIYGTQPPYQGYQDTPPVVQEQLARHIFTNANAGTASPRQVVEHQIKPMRLEPMERTPVPPIISVPQPYVINAGGNNGGGDGGNRLNTKQEMYEMMMMQNAQMHSMMMQQLMVSNMPKPHSEQRHSSLDVNLEEIVSLRDLKRPKSVHHHHYDPTPPIPHAPAPYPYTLPPISVPFAPPMPYMSPRYLPIEAEPLKQPRARRKPKTPPPPPPPPKPVQKKVYGKLPFPGPWALRKFRHAAYAVFFSKALNKAIKPGRRGVPLPKANISDDFLFGIQLKEAVSALHFIYLQEGGKPNAILRQATVDGSKDYSLALNNSSASSTEKKEIQQQLSYIIENLTFEITEIMPVDGVLGTRIKDSSLYSMIQPGRKYPRGYLWNIEKDRVNFDGAGRTMNVTDTIAFYLLAGMYIGRALVTTLFFKPVEYGFLKGQPNYKTEKNLKMLATIFIYLLRKVYGGPNQNPTGRPVEIGRQLYMDDEWRDLRNGLQSSFKYAEDLMREWGKEYVKRLQDAPPI